MNDTERLEDNNHEERSFSAQTTEIIEKVYDFIANVHHTFTENSERSFKYQQQYHVCIRTIHICSLYVRDTLFMFRIYFFTVFNKVSIVEMGEKRTTQCTKHHLPRGSVQPKDKKNRIFFFNYQCTKCLIKIVCRRARYLIKIARCRAVLDI